MNPNHHTSARQRTTGACPLIAAAMAALAALWPHLPLHAEERKPAPAAKAPALSAEDQKQLAVAGARNEKASSLFEQGKYAEAETECRAAVAISERVLGAEHPATLNCRDNLAIALRKQRKDAEAETEYRASLAIRGRALGVEHPDTLKSRNTLV